MVLMMFMPKPEVRLLVPHEASVGLYGADGYMRLDPYDQEHPARAKTSTQEMGAIAVAGQEMPLYGVGILNETVHLDDPQPGVYYITSKMTALAAGPERTDILFLYGDRRSENGAFIGVKGLGRPCFQPQINNEQVCFADQYDRVENTAPYPMNIYGPATPGLIKPCHKPLLRYGIERSPEKATKLRYDDGGMIDHELSREIGMTVYSTPLVQGVENHNGEPGDGVLRLANPNVLLTLGMAGIARGYVTPVMEVRNGEVGSPYYNTILGGRGVGVYLPMEHII